MTSPRTPLHDSLSWIWHHCSAFFGVVLIILALVIGYRWGRSDSTGTPLPTPSTAAESTPKLYTCSMHPSVRLSDPNAKCPICFMDLIPVADDGGGPGSAQRLTLSREAAALADIETARVGRYFPRAEVRLFGKVTYDETSVARLTSYFPGRVERLFVNYVGIPVRRGDHLAELYSPTLLTAFEELRQAPLGTLGHTAEVSNLAHTERAAFCAQRFDDCFGFR